MCFPLDRVKLYGVRCDDLKLVNHYTDAYTIFSVKFPENLVRFCRGYNVFYIVEFLLTKFCSTRSLQLPVLEKKEFCPSFGMCRKNSVP